MPNYKNPTVHPIPNAINLDAAIEAVQTKLGNIPWLEVIYGRAFILPGSDDITTLKREPKVYAGQKEYESAMPNDNVVANCFFYVPTAETLIDYSNLDKKQKKSVSLSIIFWWNYKKVDSSKDYLFLEEIKRDIEAQLYACRQLTIESVVDNDVRAIYNEFDISELGNELLLYPCGAVRYNCNISYITLCE